MKSPTPEDIIKARKNAGLTQGEAAELIYKSARAWQYYESNKPSENRQMDPAYWELFQIKSSGLTS